jgi:hypothetical protein
MIVYMIRLDEQYRPVVVRYVLTQECPGVDEVPGHSCKPLAGVSSSGVLMLNGFGDDPSEKGIIDAYHSTGVKL